MISQIEKCCDELKNMIQLRAIEDKPNEEDIRQKLNEIKILLLDIEGEDEKTFGYFKFQFHYYNALYLKTEGKDKEAEIQEKLAKRFEQFKRNNPQKEEQKIEPPDSFPIDDIQTMKNNLKCLKEVLDDMHSAKIEQLLNIVKTVPATFGVLGNMILLKASFDNLTDELSLRLNENQFSKEVKNLDRKEVKDLKGFLDKKVYSRKIDFINFVLNHHDPKSVIFDDVPKIVDRIEHRFRLFSRIFHPDKTSWIKAKHQSLGTEVFKLIANQKDELLKELEKENEVNPYEEKGNKNWDYALDYRRAYKGELDQLRSLRKEDFSNLTPEELKSLSISYGQLAYENYRAACKAIDAQDYLEKQIELRGKIALCLYFIDCWLEAQIYAISALRIIFKNSNKVKLETLMEAKKIYQKVKGDSGQPSAESNQSSRSETKFALVKTESSKSLAVSMAYSYEERKKNLESINQELSLIESEMITRPERSLVKYQTSKEAILRARHLSTTNKIAGAIGMAQTVFVGGAAGISAGTSAFTAIVEVSAIAGPIGIGVGILIGGIVLFSGFTLSVRLFKKGQKHLEEPEIREKLNSIIEAALVAYDNGEYDEFILQLSTEYAKDKKSLIELKPDEVFENELTFNIDFDNLIESLLAHGFRPDGIGYLLNLIGEVLSSHKIEIGKQSTQRLITLANEAFKKVSSDILKVKAKDLDDTLSKKKISNWKKTNKYGSYLRLMLLGKNIDNDLIAEEYLTDAQEMPFQSRLEEMVNIALINMAIISIKQNFNSENVAEELIQKVKESVRKSFQFVSLSVARLDALEDFLWVIKSGDVNKNSLVKLPLENTNKNTRCKRFLSQMKSFPGSSPELELEAHNKLALHYERTAQSISKADRLKSLRNWQKAKDEYFEVLRLNSSDKTSAIGVGRCLINLARYKQAYDFLNKRKKDLKHLTEFWLLSGISLRKQNKYGQAKACIVESLKMDPQNKASEKERDILRKLQLSLEERTLDWYRQSSLNSKNSTEEKRKYKILFIDSGGMRTLLPSLWLSEIERKTKKPICSLFDMMAGPSLAGFIAAGLSRPQRGDLPKSNLKAQYSASEFLEFFNKTPERLFKSNWFFGQPKLSFFQEYFGERLLSDFLNDIVIPVVKEHDHSTYIFNSHDVRDKSSEDAKIVDILMTSSTSSINFPSHRIKDMGTFLDGRLMWSNPSVIAYNEAIRYKTPKENIFMLSLGTGSYIPDPFDLQRYSEYRCLKKPSNIPIVFGQEEIADAEMHEKLGGDNYQRWQVLLKEPICFGDYSEESRKDLMEIGQQYIEELYTSEDNQFNKLLEVLQDN